MSKIINGRPPRSCSNLKTTDNVPHTANEISVSATEILDANPTYVDNGCLESFQRRSSVPEDPGGQDLANDAFDDFSAHSTKENSQAFSILR